MKKPASPKDQTAGKESLGKPAPESSDARSYILIEFDGNGSADFYPFLINVTPGQIAVAAQFLKIADDVYMSGLYSALLAEMGKDEDQKPSDPA